jgi:hypothetical protein
MENWKKVILHKDDMPVRVYVNADDTRAIVFPLFGRYFVVNSDKSALDLFVEILFHIPSDDAIPSGIRNYSQYVNSQEDTQVIFQEAA